MIFIFSSPRSGSTWLAQLLGSHPDTIYLHEPDLVDRGNDLLPYWFAQEPAGYEEKALEYLLRLCANRNLRTVGVPPFFRKRYRSEFNRLLRAGLIYLGKGTEKAGYLSLANKLSIPDFATCPAGATPTLVIKSVSALGRAEAFLRSGHPMAAILLLRHPCGYVHSYLQGVRLGLMAKPSGLGTLLETRSARRLNAKTFVHDGSEYVDQLCWEWLLANSEAHAAISKAGGMVLNYDDLAKGSEAKLHTLFATLGLEWSDRTSQFLKQTSSIDGSYYSLSRSAGAADRWISQMAPQDVERVRDIVCRDTIGRRFFNFPS
ncbi:MAG TPA: sulfotransferase [Rhizomicrobium sp.]|nr:sulfotransferase [Rhizomicrobium sp.]